MPLSREVTRRSIRQATVWPGRVVVVPPQSDLPARFEQIAEPVHIEAFIPEPAVEALYVAVLNWLPRLDVICRDLPLHTPGQKMP